MNIRSYTYRKAGLILWLIFFMAPLYSQTEPSKEKKEPFKINGQIGSQAGFYHSNEASASRPPWSYHLYGNFSPEIYGIAIPISFMMNQYGNSYTHPFSQFGISPNYKWAKIHLGYSHIRMNPLIFEGQSFRGAGLELNPGLLRFSSFYGKLNNKINADSTSGQFIQPQFSRTGYGVKLGAGNADHHFDLIYFHATDDTTSIGTEWRNEMNSLKNSVIGASFKTTPLQNLVVTGNIATSGLTKDLSLPSEDSVKLNFMEGFFSKLIPFNSSTVVRFGGQMAVNAVFKNYNTSFTYKRVDPGFKSLGTPYMYDDVEVIYWMNNLSLFSHRININSNISNQHNNLKKDLSTEMKTLLTSVNLNTSVLQNLYLYLNYSGYFLHQKDATMALTDSTRMNQQIHQVDFMPSYTIYDDVRSHNISTGINLMSLKDGNPTTAPFTNSRNISSSINYTMGFNSTGINISGSGSYNAYIQDTSKYTTYGINVGGSGQFLKNKALNTQISIGYYLNHSSFNGTQNNITFSGNMSYRYLQHSFRLNINYIHTPYNPINEIIEKTITRAVASKNLISNLMYQYSF